MSKKAKINYHVISNGKIVGKTFTRKQAALQTQQLNDTE